MGPAGAQVLILPSRHGDDQQHEQQDRDPEQESVSAPRLKL
jgi:hypothetical protein